MSSREDTVGDRSPRYRSRGVILSGTVWMLVLSVLLSWFPAFGPLIAGFVGGQKGGGVPKGLVAGILPAVLLEGLLLTVGGSLDLGSWERFSAARRYWWCSFTRRCVHRRDFGGALV